MVQSVMVAQQRASVLGHMCTEAPDICIGAGTWRAILTTSHNAQRSPNQRHVRAKPDNEKLAMLTVTVRQTLKQPRQQGGGTSVESTKALQLTVVWTPYVDPPTAEARHAARHHVPPDAA